MSGWEIVRYVNSKTYCGICLTSIWNIINASNKFNRANFFYHKQGNEGQCDLHSHHSQSAETPSNMSGREVVDYFKSKTYCRICRNSTWNIVNTWIQYNCVNFFLSDKKQRYCQCEQHYQLRQSVEEQSYMFDCKVVGYFNSQTYSSICLTSIWNFINTSN